MNRSRVDEQTNVL